MTGEVAHGAIGEQIAEYLLIYEGWTILEKHPKGAGGHRLDRLARAPDGSEWLIEVKVWRDPGAVGTDNLKKALADAYDLKAAGETRPVMLVLSHELNGLLGRMIHRALEAGVLSDVRIVGLLPRGAEL